MSVGRRHNIPLPANGHEIAEIVAKEVELSLKKHFRIALSYPNATVKFQWSATFYSAPFHEEDSQLITISAEGRSISSLVDEGLEPEMVMDSLEIGISTPSSPALVRPGLPSLPSLPPSATESLGRRDINARRGRGIDRVAGQFIDPSLTNVGDQSRVVAAVRTELADVEKGEDQPLHQSSILVGDELEGGEDN